MSGGRPDPEQSLRSGLLQYRSDEPSKMTTTFRAADGRISNGTEHDVRLMSLCCAPRELHRDIQLVSASSSAPLRDLRLKTGQTNA